MIICQSCGAQNEDHYKFCLSCGSELSQATAAPVVDRPSKPSVQKQSAEGPQENRPRIPNLKARLQALRTGRDALVERQGKERGVSSKKEQQLPGWTAPPMVASPVANAAVPAVGEQQSELDAPRTTQKQEQNPDLDVESIARTDGETVPLGHPADDAELTSEPSEHSNFMTADSNIRVDEAGVSTNDQDPVDGDEPPIADDDNDGSTEAADGEPWAPSKGSEAQVQLPAPMSVGGSNAVESAPELDMDGLTQTQPAMERLVVQYTDGSEDLPTETQSLRGNEADSESVGRRADELNGGQEQNDLADSDARETVVAPMVSDDMSPCPACGAMQPNEFKFCGNCGARLEGSGTDQKADLKPQVQSIGKMTLIHSDGSEGVSFDLGDGNLVLGREHINPLFSDDQCLSPVHAELVYSDGWLTIKDLGSLNGIFVRLRGDTRLIDGDRFRIGQQLFRFESLGSLFDGVRPQNDGTHVLGSPTSGLWGRLVCMSSAGDESMAWTLKTPEIYLGRDRGTIRFPDDVFISGSHCRLRRDNDGAQISDLSSTNGTYVQLKSDFAISTGDLVLLGQRLYRFDLAQR
ncbi:MAG: FHA domain-containing protein [Myxococcota bacterium]|nr:FHA domain-containing protein [Myxococcota bacterium]